MKKAGKLCLALIFSFLFALPVLADVQSDSTGPDYKTDYYMIVESKAGGINIYAQPDLESSKLNEELIPNGTALHIEGEVEDKEADRTWGYTEYHGMYGYVPLDDCKPAQSRQEAIDSELYIAGKDNVNYNADYDVTASSDEGSQKLYQGPGEKYGSVPGAREIQNGEILHITQDAEMVDGSRWGVTSVDGKEGWMDLDKTEESREKQDSPENARVRTGSESETETEPDPSAEETVQKPEPTKAPSVTEAPSATKTPSVTEAPSATKVPSSTEAPSATKAPSSTEAPLATKVPSATERPEMTETPKTAAAETAQNASSQEVEADSSEGFRPFIWIAVAAFAAVIVLLLYHFKKRE